MVDTKILRGVPLFQNLKDPDLKALGDFAVVRKVAKGEELFAPGDHRNTFIIVLSGELHIFRMFNDEVQTLAYLDTNEFAVESALVDPSLKHEHNGEMISDGELLVIDGRKFRKFRESHPVIANQIYGTIVANLTERLHHANNKLVTIYSTGIIASTYDNLDNLSDLVLTTILKVIRAKRALFVLFEPLEGKALVRDAKGYLDNQSMRNLSLPLGSDPILGQLYRVPRELRISAEHYASQKELHTPYASRNMLGAPLHLHDRVLGAILLGDKQGEEEFSHNNAILLGIIARQIVLPVAIAEMVEKQRA